MYKTIILLLLVECSNINYKQKGIELNNAAKQGN